MTSPDIQLFELGPTRSARARWALLEAGLSFDSLGNDLDVFSSGALREVHPLGKLPAMIVDGRPLFESAAIITAIADMVPDKKLIAAPGTWERNLHYQWVSFAQSEMEAFVQSSEINSIDFILPVEQHVPDIIEQNNMLYRKAAQALDNELSGRNFLVDNRFSVTDIFVGYTVSWGREEGLIKNFSHLNAYLDRLLQRPYCPLKGKQP